MDKSSFSFSPLSHNPDLYPRAANKDDSENEESRLGRSTLKGCEIIEIDPQEPTSKTYESDNQQKDDISREEDHDHQKSLQFEKQATLSKCAFIVVI